MAQARKEAGTIRVKRYVVKEGGGTPGIVEMTGRMKILHRIPAETTVELSGAEVLSAKR